MIMPGLMLISEFFSFQCFNILILGEIAQLFY